MQKAAVVAIVAAQLGFAAVSCTPAGKADRNADSSGTDTVQTTSEWRPLFDGRTLQGWRGYRAQSVPAGWRAVDGMLTKDSIVGDLLTVDQFGDFELAFEWRLGEGGNAGAFYRGTEEYDYIYWSAPEYQLLDDARHVDGKNRLTAAGAAYGLYPAPAGVVKPAGQWNSTLVVVRGNHVEHWLNDRKLLEYEIGSPDWEAKVKASKFVEYPNYGRARRGHIGIQGDHEGALSLRNLRIREVR